MKLKNKLLTIFILAFFIATIFSLFSFINVKAIGKDDFSNGEYDYPGEFGPITLDGETPKIYQGTGDLQGYYIHNFRHGYAIAETDDYTVVQTMPSSIYYATGNKHLSANGVETFCGADDMLEISRAYGLAYLNGNGAVLQTAYKDFLLKLSLGTLEDAPLLADVPFNVGIVMNTGKEARLYDMTGVYYRYGDSTVEKGKPLGLNASYSTTGKRMCFVSVSGNDTVGWKFILIKDDFLTTYGKVCSTGTRLGKAISFERKLTVDGVERIVQLFEYGFLYVGDNGNVQADTTRYYDLKDNTFKEVPVQAFINVPEEFGEEVGTIIEKDGKYYQNYQLGVAVGEQVKNGYEFVAKANYNFDEKAGELKIFTEDKIDAYVEQVKLNADALSYLEANLAIMKNQLVGALKAKFKDLLSKGVNPGVPSGNLILTTGSAEGINEVSVTGVQYKAVYLKTVGGDSTYNESQYVKNVAFLMVSKNDNGEFVISIVADKYMARYSAVMGAALNDACQMEINGVTYDSAQIYENAYVFLNKETNKAEAHLQYSYDFNTKKATINKLKKEQVCYVLDYAVYGFIRWTDETIPQINSIHGTNVTKEQVIDAMWTAYERYVDAGINPGLPYGEGIMLFGNVIKIGFSGSDNPGGDAATTKEVAYLMYNPQMDKAFLSNGAIIELGNSGYATSTVDRISDLGAPTEEVTVQDDGTVYQNFTTGAVVCLKGKMSFARFIEGGVWTGELPKDTVKNEKSAEQAAAREKEFKKNPKYVEYLESLSKTTAEALASITVLAALKFCI